LVESEVKAGGNAMKNGSVFEEIGQDGGRTSIVRPRVCHTGEYSKTQFCDDRPSYQNSDFTSEQLKLKDECNYCHEILEPLFAKPKLKG
jgi:hypothetical protein